jgi:TetR/AcrR family transcriptional repressor of nem operon
MARKKEFDPVEMLERARDIFWEKGYHITSMEDLVTHMQVNRRSMYDTYGDKHKLFIESLRNYALETYEEYRLAALGENSALKAIKLILNKAIKRSFEQNKVCMIVKTSFEVGALDSDIMELLKQLNLKLILILEDLIIKAQVNNEVNRNKNAKESAQFIVGSLAGLWQMQILYNDIEMIQQMAKRLIESLE